MTEDEIAALCGGKKAAKRLRDRGLSKTVPVSRSPSLHRESLLNPTNQPPESGER